MPSLSQHQSLEYVKALVLGNPGAGKTGGLVSLVKAGYRIRIFDFDNLLDPLVQFILKECPERVDQVSFQTFTDKMKGRRDLLSMVGASMKVNPMIDGTAKAFLDCLTQMTHWKTETEDLGDPSQWGKDTVLVVDSLTTASLAAFRFAQSMNPGAKEPQTYYFAAQQMIVQMINLLCSKQFSCHVLVLAHITYDRDEKGNLMKGWPRSIGSALNDQLAGYFSSALMFERSGSRRSLITDASGIIDLKNPVSFKVAPRLPIETGYADFFKAALST